MTSLVAGDVGGWLEEVFASIDAMDSEGFAEFLSQDGEFRFGSAPAVVGRENIASAVAGFFETIEGCSHQISNVWTGPETVVCEGDVTYRRKDRSAVALPFVDVFDMEGGLISRYKIYIDIGPLYDA